MYGSLILTEPFVCVYSICYVVSLTCIFVSACMFVCACCVETEGGSGGTDGSCSGLVWCSVPAKDQAKTVTALCTLFSPAQESKNRRCSHIDSFMSFQNVVDYKNDVCGRICSVSTFENECMFFFGSFAFC